MYFHTVEKAEKSQVVSRKETKENITQSCHYSCSYSCSFQLLDALFYRISVCCSVPAIHMHIWDSKWLRGVWWSGFNCVEVSGFSLIWPKTLQQRTNLGNGKWKKMRKYIQYLGGEVLESSSSPCDFIHVLLDRNIGLSVPIKVMPTERCYLYLIGTKASYTTGSGA